MSWKKFSGAKNKPVIPGFTLRQQREGKGTQVDVTHSMLRAVASRFFWSDCALQPPGSPSPRFARPGMTYVFVPREKGSVS